MGLVGGRSAFEKNLELGGEPYFPLASCSTLIPFMTRDGASVRNSLPVPNLEST